MTAGTGDRSVPEARTPNIGRQLSPRWRSAPAAPNLDERQREFALALLDPERQLPPGLIGPDGRPGARRFNVYRNNVVAGLTAAVNEAFPAVVRIVGDEFFSAMARIYVAERPPRSPIMLHYGKGLPDFIGSFGPLQALPYLRDVARIEWAWVEAYHASEARPLKAEAFAAISPDHLPHLRVMFHPSLRLVRSQFPAPAIWRMNVADGVLAAVDLDAGGDDVLVVRPDAEVEVRSRPPGGAAFVQALSRRRSILEAMKDATTADDRFDLAASLAGLMGAHAIIGHDVATHLLPLARPA